MRGDHRLAQGADRALLPEQRRRIQSALGACAGADLEMDVPVRVTRAARAVRRRDRSQGFDWHDFLRTPRADPGHGVLRQPQAGFRRASCCVASAQHLPTAL